MTFILITCDVFLSKIKSQLSLMTTTFVVTATHNSTHTKSTNQNKTTTRAILTKHQKINWRNTWGTLSYWAKMPCDVYITMLFLLVSVTKKLLVKWTQFCNAQTPLVWFCLMRVTVTVTSAATLNSFQKHLKTHLFHCPFASLWLLTNLWLSLWMCPCSYSSWHTKSIVFNNNKFSPK